MFGSLVGLMVIITALIWSERHVDRVPARPHDTPLSPADGAIAVARERFRRGEIDREDFCRIARVLRS